jgi:hypothetical protein
MTTSCTSCAAVNIEIKILPNDLRAIFTSIFESTSNSSSSKPVITQLQWDHLIIKHPQLSAFTGANLKTLISTAQQFDQSSKENFRGFSYCQQANGTYTLAPLGTIGCKTIEQLSKDEMLRIQWPPVSLELVDTVLSHGLVTPTTQLKDLEDYLQYARDLPDGNAEKRILIDIEKLKRVNAKAAAPPEPPVTEEKQKFSLLGGILPF